MFLLINNNLYRMFHKFFNIITYKNDYVELYECLVEICYKHSKHMGNPPLKVSCQRKTTNSRKYSTKYLLLHDVGLRHSVSSYFSPTPLRANVTQLHST